ncbi:MAG: hypothetical protein K2N63_12375 [Lachnospiraceae bacterium]|nr:hypothetical protein [Lachnospiraceae bacterium]
MSVLETQCFHGLRVSENTQRKIGDVGTMSRICIKVDGKPSYYYEEPLKDGKPHGKGKQFEIWGLTEYDFEALTACGLGATCGALKYEGDFVDGKWEGQGKYFRFDELVYEGGFRNGERYGWGKLYDVRGEAYYDGEVLKIRRRDPSDGYFLGDIEPGWLVEKDGKIYLHTKDGGSVYYGSSAQNQTQDSVPTQQAGTPSNQAAPRTPIPSTPYVSAASKVSTLSSISVDCCLAEIDSMIGLSAVKRQVRDLVNMIW